MNYLKILLFLLLFHFSLSFSQTFNYPFPYNSNGTPDNLDFIGIPTELDTFMHNYFEDGVSIPGNHPQLISNENEVNIFLTKDAEIWVTFIDESAGYSNALGFYTYPKGNVPASPNEITHNIIFPNVEDGTWQESGSPSLSAGSRIYLGQFPAGTVIGWFLVVDGWNDASDIVEPKTFGPENNGNFVSDWIFYSNTNFNPNNTQQNVFVLYPGSDPNVNTRILGFEDVLRGSSEDGHPYDDQDFDDVLFYITSNAVDAIEETVPSVTVTSPDGGEQYSINSLQEITWTSNNMDNVALYYSLDNGNNWTLLTSSTSDDGSFYWTTPNIPSTQCLIRITDAANPAIMDESDNAFTLFDGTPVITVLAPNGNERYLENTVQTITWSSVGVDQVRIEYSYNNGDNWIQLTSSMPDDGHFEWTTPSIITDTYLVKITDASNHSILDVSDENFEVYEMTAPEGVKYVDWTAPGPIRDGLSWETAYVTLQDALAVASYGDEIWVADGTYYPDEGGGQRDNNINSTYNIPDGVKIYGGFGGWNDGDETAVSQRDLSTKPSILSGFIKRNGRTRNSYHVVKFENVSAETLLDGFTIQDGQAKGSGVDAHGGGIILLTNGWEKECNPIISNVIVTANSASSGGGIANIANQWQHPINRGTFINCLVFDNDADSENSSGIYHDGQNVSASYGIFSHYINCTIVDNIYNFSNQYNGNCDPLFQNSILRGTITNSGNSVDPVYSYCNVRGGAVGTGNIDQDPLFVGGGDYHLQSSSPSINTGNNAYITPWTAIDLEGNSRIQPFTVDMGTYEYTTHTSITFADGSTFHPATAVASANQAIGRFMLNADNSSASMASINIMLAGVRSGAYNFKLWHSEDDQFDPASDAKIGNTVSMDPGIDGTVTFSTNHGIDFGAGYYFLTCDLTGDATGQIRPYIEITSDIAINAGTIITPIVHAPLSAYDTSLSVSLTYFKGQLKNSRIYLEWQTGSEINNRGFSIERRENEGNWIVISSYLRNSALKGAGNASESMTYRYTDTEIISGSKYDYRLKDIDFSNKETIHEDNIITILVKNEENTVEEFAIQSIYPNPFNPTANIRYNISTLSRINISIYDVRGNLINTLVNQHQSPGIYTVSWDGTDTNNRAQSGGIYFAVMMQNNKLVSTQKLLFVK
ncbi:MAG: DUF4114 domain-containing protein [Candidatus Marinimicrobia bacterium]|nr:DUF4114 domain-containing protein [Candidatus Neomarinimicrobiota bacterium]